MLKDLIQISNAIHPSLLGLNKHYLVTVNNVYSFTTALPRSPLTNISSFAEVKIHNISFSEG